MSKDKWNNEVDDRYLQLLSRGGLTVPGKFLSDLVNHAFATLDLLEDILLKYAKDKIRMVARKVLMKYLGGYCISCTDENHQTKTKKLVLSSVVNVFFNNKQKEDGDVKRRDTLEAFKRNQRAKCE